jgi:hypothetical protein
MNLYISSRTDTSEQAIVKALLHTNTDSQIVKNSSSSKYGGVETGYHIKLFEITENNFKERVWDILQPMLSLECAFVDSLYYKGCTSNWSPVFRKSSCPTYSFRESKQGSKRTRSQSK